MCTGTTAEPRSRAGRRRSGALAFVGTSEQAARSDDEEVEAVLGRAVIAQGNPAKVDEVVAYVRDRVQPLVEAEAGSHGLSMFANRETGMVVVSTSWQDEDALNASDEHLAAVRREALTLLEAPEPRIEIMEPAVIFQNAPDQPGYWSRASETRYPVDRLEEAIATFTTQALPAIRERFEGVNTIALLVNRRTGHSVANVTYTSREALDASRDSAEQLRTESLRRTGAEPANVMELEVAIVGIRPPVDLPSQGGPVEFPATITT